MWIKSCITLGLMVLHFDSVMATPATPLISINHLKTHTTFLSSETLEGRLTGSQGEQIATQYVADYFQKLGLEPIGNNRSFFQEFEFNGLNKNSQQKQYGRNVLARLKINPVSESVIIIGAHADHLGRGEPLTSRGNSNETQFIHYGADDNASGVACVLEAAAQLSDLKSQGKLHGNKDIVFAIWSGEELGLLGSTHFIKNWQDLPIDSYVNLDMVGRLRDKLIIQGVGSSLSWPTLITQSNRKHRIAITTQKDPYLPTDSTAFYLRSIPAINLFTGAHSEYHTPKDTLARLNFAGMQIVTHFLVDLIIAIENKSMDYQSIPKTTTQSRSGFKVYLGTIPDYSSEDNAGVKLSGVSKNSPAEHAGLRQDDVIVEFLGKKIHDVYDYSSALRSLHDVKPVSLVVLREQKKLTLTISPEYRAQQSAPK